MAKPTLVGATANTGTAITAMPAHQVGDIIVICAYRDGSTSAPSKPAASGTVPAWVDIDSGGANLNSMNVCRFVATATNHTSGTWTNATGMSAIVLRGQATSPVGAHGQDGSANNTGSIVFSESGIGISPTATDGTSYVLVFLGARTVTSWGSAPAGWTLAAQVATETAIDSLDVTTASDPGATHSATFSGNGGFRYQFVEVLGVAGSTVSKSPSGGLVLGGSASKTRTLARTSSGGLVLGGSAAKTRVVARSSSGGVVLAGSASKTRVVAASRSGGLVLGGAASLTATFALAPSGGLVLAGSLSMTLVRSVSVSGGVVLAGSAAGERQTDRSSSGGIVLAGSATSSTTVEPSMSGGLVLGGAADVVAGQGESVSPAGGLVLGGGASMAVSVSTVVAVRVAIRPSATAAATAAAAGFVTLTDGAPPPVLLADRVSATATLEAPDLGRVTVRDYVQV